MSGEGLGLDLSGTDLSALTAGRGADAEPATPQPVPVADRAAAGTAAKAAPQSAEPPPSEPPHSEPRAAEPQPSEPPLRLEPGADRPGVRLTPAEAALRGALFRRRGPLLLRQSGQQASAVLLPLPAGDMDTPADTPWLSLTIDGAPAAIAMPWSMARRLLGQPLEAAAPEDAALLLEQALGDWLDAAELATGLSLRLDRLDPAPPSLPGTIAARLGVETALPRPARQAVLLRLSPPAARALANALSRQARPRDDLPGLALRVTIERSAARLTLAELRSLRPGDALLLDDDAEPVAVVEQRFVAPARDAGGGRWQLNGPLSLRAERAPFHRQSDMTQTDPAQSDSPAPTAGPASDASAGEAPDRPAAAAADDRPGVQSDSFGVAPLSGAPAPRPLPTGPASLDGLELRLSVRVGEAMMSLSELRSAGPGTVITLDRPDGALVDLVVNGQVIGTGQIITVAGQKACEIRTLFGDG